MMDSFLFKLWMKIENGHVGKHFGLLLLVMLLPGTTLGNHPFQLSDEGRATITPSTGVAGDFGTWTVVYQAGTRGIATGGGIRIQLPDSWHAGDRNSANPLQSSDPQKDYYVSARAPRPDVEVKVEVESESDQVLVKSARKGLDGRAERYVFVVRARVVKGSIGPGETLSVIYGDTSQGSRGMRAAVISTTPEPVLVSVDFDGSGEYQRIQDTPEIQARSGPASRLLLTGPSTLEAGKESHLNVSVLDSNANPVHGFEGEIQLELLAGEAEFEQSLSLDMKQGWQTIAFTPRKPGILRMKASALGRILEAESNPMEVFTSMPERQVYWGDLHSHTHYSWDGVGSESFTYAQHISNLDFYAMTDHSLIEEEGYTRGLGPHVWEEYTRLAESHHQPGTFVTLHAYEASFGAPYGHHNVYFRGRPGPLLSPERVSLPELWKQLTRGEALTIPHHTGKMPRPVQWDFHDADFRRNFELYSAHGLSEAYDPDHPLAFEQSDFTAPSRSAKGPQFAQDAWKRGLILSAIAASDDHRSQPGKPHWGIAAVQATGLTREEIFDALYDRRTYATTGARILLNFFINGEPMGRELETHQSPQLEIQAHGTDLLEEVEVLRCCEPGGGFEVIKQFRPDSMNFQWQGQDKDFQADSVYYVRLRQRGFVWNRIAMAWSSPIWVKRASNTGR